MKTWATLVHLTYLGQILSYSKITQLTILTNLHFQLRYLKDVLFGVNEEEKEEKKFVASEICDSRSLKIAQRIKKKFHIKVRELWPCFLIATK